jgi:hypothetical protein
LINLLASLTKRREKTQSNIIRDEKENITTNTNEIQKIMREYFENLYSNILENQKEKDKFPDAFDLLKLSQENINHLSRHVISHENEIVIKSLPTKKNPGSDGFTAKLYQIFKYSSNFSMN